jgi:hypothetical protein
MGCRTRHGSVSCTLTSTIASQPRPAVMSATKLVEAKGKNAPQTNIIHQNHCHILVSSNIYPFCINALGLSPIHERHTILFGKEKKTITTSNNAK